MAANKESVKYTVFISLVLCIVCSVVVSAAAVFLKPVQQVNKSLEKKANILAAAGIKAEPGQDVNKLFDQVIITKVVDLETGKYTDAVNPATYDQRKASKDPQMSVALTQQQDIASIKRVAKYATVYLVEKDSKLETIVLPVKGYGLWSTLYGFVALKGDLNTVVGMGFYEQGETPGLGGEVDNPAWKGLWPGKQIFADGDLQQANMPEPKIHLIKGKVDRSAPNAAHEVDGLSGATLTSNGVTHLMQFWFGQSGFGPFLKNLRAGEA
ncbi:Na(+)-translocating NADH-quinone reductase subunit C [Pokkaliibacter sp. MBI-7]|uniref:Na(+)-translocating NADH-quinone reductase subunit C n=1 Tax=Proteobacteria bacterium 228 TaxID=2083153 RepID=A0A2S5KI13_9PROT|nr:MULTISPECIES: Na(+)-translocating NADH-quinone reductase subunit C [Pokkaliibacter]MDH2434928.1 Na(+)-translocating NADH-quinone reductase subunit C [Pokkaliibacter sp. MBI-7]PPC74149.1 Na(+)-translocating NADH-quinone reductase subunit C [Pokkaliibacter plantistimulans]